MSSDPYAVKFDGTNDYMTRGAGLTGAADSKKGIISFWFRRDVDTGAAEQILNGTTTVGGALDIFNCEINPDAVRIVCTGLSISSSTIPTSQKWRHFVASWDLATAGARHIYVDGVSDITVTTFTDTTIDYTGGDWSVGGGPNGTERFNGCLSQLYFQPGEYLDLSDAGNLAKFISTTQRPVDLGATGTNPTGNQPLILLETVSSDAATVFATNKGSGGNFAITGTLDVATSRPTFSYFGSASTPADAVAAIGTADPTAVTPPSGMLAGDLVCMIGHQRAAAATLAVSAAGGQTWTTETAASGTNCTTRLFWCTFNGTWSTDPSVDFSATTCNTAVMHVFRPPTTGYTWSVNQAQQTGSDATSPFTIAGQTTTGTGPTVTLAIWASPDDNTYGTLTGTGWEVTGTAQYRNTSGSDQSCSFAHKIQTAAGATGDTSKLQATLGADTTTTTIITFAATAPAVAGTIFDPIFKRRLYDVRI